MSAASVTAPAESRPAAIQARPENLALGFQELFTVIARFRAGRQNVSDAAVFRNQIKQMIKAAEERSRRKGYSQEDTRLAIFAVVAFLDESILNSDVPALADWARKPLQEELFGVHMAGEVFFQSLDRLLSRDDSLALADLLEVYYLCLLLGYGGQYTIGQRGDLRHVIDTVGRRLYHIRRDLRHPDYAALPEDQVKVSHADPWARRLGYIFLASLVLTLGCFGFYWFFLDSGASELGNFVVTRGA